MSIADEQVDTIGNLENFARDSGHLEEGKPLFPAVTMAELMGTVYKVVFFCRGVLAKGQPAIIGGPHKVFKTTLSLLLAVCLATGKSFLDHFDVPERVKVCYFTGEGGLAVIQDTLRRIGDAIGVDISVLNNIVVTDRVPRLDNLEHLAALKSYLEEHTPAVVFFDPLYLAMSGADTSNVFSMGERLRALNELCVPLGITPVLLHHLKKNRIDCYAPAGLEDLSMAGFAEFAGQWILLSRRTAYDPDDPTHRLWASFGGRTGHGSAWGLDIFEGTIDDEGGRVWQPELRRQDEVRAEAHGQKAQKRIEQEQSKQAEFESLTSRTYAWMVGKPDGVTKRMVRAAMRLGADKADQVVAFLEESGSIEKCEVEVKNSKSVRKASGYRAISGDEETLFV